MQLYKFSILCAGLIFNLASLQQIIGINPSYIILLLKNSIKIREIILLSVVCFFLAYQTFIENYIIINYLQILLDIALGFLIFNIITLTKNQTTLQIISRYTNFLICLAILSAFDYYFLGTYLNNFLSWITLWGNSGDFIPRLSLTFGNPNWGSFTCFLFLVIAYLLKSSFLLKMKILSLIIFFQSKSAILIAIFFVIINSKNPIRKSLIFFSVIAFSLFSFPIISIQDTASYFYRLIMYEEILNITQLYPLGLIGESELRYLISSTSEDTLPTILTLLYGLGWIFFILFLVYYLIKIFQSRIQLSIGISLGLFSLVYSFLSTSIVAGIGVTLFLLAINKDAIRLDSK